MNRSFSELYKKAIDLLYEHITESIIGLTQGDTIIVPIPRKGPRLMDFMKAKNKNKKGLESALICSEHSLPFLFGDAETVKKIKRIIIVDDAVYYGTTITGVYNIVNTYKAILNAEFDIKVIAGIRDTNANTGSIEVTYDEENREKSFGYYYIKRLAKDLNKINATLEIEFPTLCYRLRYPKGTDVHGLLAKNMTRVSGCKDTYFVKTYKKSSVTAMFRTDENLLCSFRKCRFNISHNRGKGEHAINVTVMSPYALSNEESDLKMIFDDVDDIRPYWIRLVTEAIPDNVRHVFKVTETTGDEPDNALMYGELKRLKTRSIVIAANYIASVLFFMQIKKELEAALQCDFIDFDGLNRKDFHNIFGYSDTAKELLDKLNAMMTAPEEASDNPDAKLRLLNVYVDRGAMVFEKNYPKSQFTLPVFRSRVKELLGNAKNASEAVSALFFLQNGLIEKETRKQEKFNYYRLFFGQTFASIKQFLRESTNRRTREKTIHRLVDMKIDQCNIVPQYILDCETKNWRRVFRPGENEDLYLSHMARFVIMVYNELAGHFSIQDVPEYILNGFLVYLTKVCNKKLKKDLNISFSKDKNGCLMFLNRENGLHTDVLAYLERMKILDKKNEFVKVNEHLADESLTQVTTLDRNKVETTIKDRIEALYNKINEYGLGLDSAYMVLNAYTLGKKEIENAKVELCPIMDSIEQFLLNTETSLEKPEDEKATGLARSRNKVIINSFRYFSKYLALPELVAEPKIKRFEEKLFTYKQASNLVTSMYILKNKKTTEEILNKHNGVLGYSEKLVKDITTDFDKTLVRPGVASYMAEKIRGMVQNCPDNTCRRSETLLN